VGAAHPVHHSVTKWFSDCGWSGVNVEPLPAFADLLRQQRPRDVTLQVACSRKGGLSTLHEVPDCVGMATLEAEVRDTLESQGRTVAEASVTCITLNEICESHVNDRMIDFMKIDVEGHEAAVLEGLDLRRWRPRILVVEATIPGSPAPSHHGWEPQILSNDYMFAQFDGLNRYYVRSEDLILVEMLGTPVNVFDDFISCGDDPVPQQLTNALARLEIQWQASRAETVDLRQRLDDLSASTVPRAAQQAALRMMKSARAHAETLQRHLCGC